MGRTLRDFQCTKCDKLFERFIDTNAEYVECDCGGVAYRIIGMPTVKLDGTDPGFPGAYEKWAKVREDNARIKSKRFSAER